MKGARPWPAVPPGRAGLPSGPVALLVLLLVMPWDGVTAARSAPSSWPPPAWRSPGADPRPHWRPTVLFFPWLCYLAAALLSLVWAVEPGLLPARAARRGPEGHAGLLPGGPFHLGRGPPAAGLERSLVGVALMGPSGSSSSGTSRQSPAHQVRAGSLHNGYGGLGTYLTLVWPLVLLAPGAWGGRFGDPAFGAGRPDRRGGLPDLQPGAWLGLLLETACAVGLRPP